MKTKNTIILLALMFTASFVLSGCMQKKVKKSQQKQPVVQQEQKEESVNEDAIDFSDPGDDDLGKDIQEIDDLINETSPGEYNEDDLSEEGFDAELQ